MTKSFKDRAIFLDGDDDPQAEDDSPGGGDCQGHPVHVLLLSACRPSTEKRISRTMRALEGGSPLPPRMLGNRHFACTAASQEQRPPFAPDALVHALRLGAQENFITATSDKPLINAQSKMPCSNGRGPTFRNACRLSPAPIRNRVSVIPIVAIRVS